MLKGIDVSKHQGFINWPKVKDSINFAIIHMGYGDDIASQDDDTFLSNARACIANNIPFGVYLYSYAKNLSGTESIASEVNHCLRLLSKLSQKPFCVYLDMEDSSTTYLKKIMLTNFALEFCKEITKAGYKSGIYANENWFKNYLNCSTIASYGYSIWCAKYSSQAPQITSNYDLWQYSDSGRVEGINGFVDTNYLYNESLIASKPISKPTTNTKVNVYYRVKTSKYGWLSEVKNLEDYAGYNNDPITGLAIKVDKGSVRYRVHVKNGKWLPWVTGYNIKDSKSGYAGNGKPIDLVEAYYNTPASIRPFKKAKYKVNGYSWQHDSEKTNNQDGYAGLLNINAVKFQITIE